MVLVTGAEKPPKVQQYDHAKALKEAERLAILTGRRVYLLEAQMGFQIKKEKIKTFNTDQTRVKGPAQPPKKIKPPKPEAKAPELEKPTVPAPVQKSASPEVQVIVKKKRRIAMPAEA